MIETIYNIITKQKQIFIKNQKNVFHNLIIDNNFLKKLENFKLIRINTNQFINALCFDIDHEKDIEDFFNLPAPNFVIYNKQNRKKHIVFLLKNTIILNHKKVLNFYKDVYNSLVLQLEADPNYTNQLIKNPFNKELYDYREIHSNLFELNDFIDYIIKEKKKKFFNNYDIGRNNKIFNELRIYAYRNRNEIMRKNNNNEENYFNNLLNKCIEITREINLNTKNHPQGDITMKETKTITKSIFKFTKDKEYFENINRGRYHEEVKNLKTLKQKQQKSAQITSRIKQIKNESITETAIKEMFLINEKITIKKIQEKTQQADKTIQKYYKNFKDEIKKHNQNLKKGGKNG